MAGVIPSLNSYSSYITCMLHILVVCLMLSRVRYRILTIGDSCLHVCERGLRGLPRSLRHGNVCVLDLVNPSVDTRPNFGVYLEGLGH